MVVFLPDGLDLKLSEVVCFTLRILDTREMQQRSIRLESVDNVHESGERDAILLTVKLLKCRVYVDDVSYGVCAP